MNPKNERTDNEQPKSGKKTYKTPTLRIYGDLHEITKASTTPGTNIDSRNPYSADRTS